MRPDYDIEFATYDETRGGTARAKAAAEAIDSLLGPRSLVLDVAGGTGIVAALLRDRGHRVLVVDRSTGMLGLARGRVPGGVVQADAAVLPVADRSADAVVTLWLLHLLGDVAPVIDEASRVLGLGGRFVTTVDKALVHGYGRGAQPDDRARVIEITAGRGLRLLSETTFVGHGQGLEGGSDPIYPLLGFVKEG